MPVHPSGPLVLYLLLLLLALGVHGQSGPCYVLPSGPRADCGDLPDSPGRLHVLQANGTGYRGFVKGHSQAPYHPAPHSTVKELGGVQSLYSLPPGRVYSSLTPCVASVLTGQPLHQFYPEELGHLLTRSACRHSYSVQVLSEEGDWSSLEIPGSSLPPELSSIAGSILLGESGTASLEFPDLQAQGIEDVDFRLVRGPRLGTLTYRGRNVSAFTAQQIHRGEIVYNNIKGWGSDHLLLEFQSNQFIYPIYILPTNQTDKFRNSSSRNKRSFQRQNKTLEFLREHRVVDLDENGLMEITNGTLRISGIASDILKVELAPKHGKLLVRGEPALQFTLADVTGQVVVYEHDGKETGHTVLKDHFRLIGRTGGVLEVEVNVHPIDDAAPRMRIEGNLRVKEGGRGKLSPRHVKVEDPDTQDKDITCHLIAQPMFGHLRVSDRPSTRFDYAKLKNGYVAYVQSVHLGLEPREDGLSVACYDTENNTESGNNFGIVNINIEGINDEPPIINPKIISVSKGGEVSLSMEVIVPKDADTPLEKLSFMIDTPPSKGVVMRKLGISEYQGVKNFTFAEMKEVYYRSGTENGEDVFTLRVSDGAQETRGKVKVLIQNEETTPQLLINEGLEIEEGSTIRITPKLLYAEDGDTISEKIQFILRDTPLFGSLLLDDIELAPSSKFSQSDIASSHLSYRHTDPSSSMDVFVFDLTDGKNTLYNQNFFITILSRNQSYPVVTSDTAIIQPLSTLVITPAVLRLKNPEENVEFHVMSPPRQGRLERRDKPEPVHSFSYVDIEEENIQYVHLTNKTLPEIIQFEVSDGHNSIFHTFNINFTADSLQYLMSAEALGGEEQTEETVTSKPVVLTNNPVHSLRKFEDGRIGTTITRRNLYAEDEGRNITYVIADPPKYGQLFNKRTNNTCGNFTQDDVNSGRLLYILKPGSRVPGDAVLLNVLGQGLPLKGLQLILEWSWVHFKTNVSVVSETCTSSKVPLVRWGSLAESAFVGISVVGGNATIGEDLTATEDQVQFSPGQSVAFLNLHIQDDGLLEGRESVVFSLLEPYSLLLDEPDSTTVYIDDPEDEPKYTFKNLRYEIFENSTEVILPVQRFGDTSKEVTLECVTENGEAEGGSKLDFLPQPGIPVIVKFAKGESESACSVLIYDDGVMEPKEDFWVKLKNGYKELSSTHLIILPDNKDYPSVSFLSDSLAVHENDGEITVNLIVNGTREIVNASVSVVATSMSAKANKDFVFHKSVLRIRAEEDRYQVVVDIIDDNKAKLYEGNETFLLSLVEPKNCVLGPRHVVAITIEDESDLPVLQFLRSNYTVSETIGQIDLEIERQGDMMGEYNVICFIHEQSATFFDFTMVPNGTYQVISFSPGEMKKNCSITIHDDNIYETKEYFTVHLKPEDKNIRIGQTSQVTITVTDEEDKEIIFFRKTHYFIKEPPTVSQNGTVKVQVSREGDSKYGTQVRVYTKDGTARSGEDYIGKSAVMTFEPGQRTFTCEIQILFDKELEIKEYFTIHLEVLNNGDTLYSRKSIVYIYDSPQPGGAMFPAAPIVVSPNGFEDFSTDKNYVIQGAPLVCISVCNKDHYLFKKFENWCKKQGISEDSTKYSWQIEDRRGKALDIPFPIFFANTSSSWLESVYVRGGSKLRCGTTPTVGQGGGRGKTSFSEYVSVSRAPGSCPPPSENMMGAEPFIAQISYSEDTRDKAKLIKVSVTIPHYDGLFPAISTHPLGDAFQILKSYTPRPEIHKCSNIITKNELQTLYGFLENDKGSLKASDLHSIRDADAVNLYRHLNLESCVWNFEAYYTLDEAVNFCGATINTESNLYDTDRTSVTLELPLYVSYYTYSVFGWQHTDTSIVLRLTFLYEGSVLSDEGVVKQEDDNLEGILHPTSMHISHNGSLVVYFKTTPKFPGYFLHHSDDGFQSYVHSVEYPEMPITLKLINNKTQLYEQEQHWIFHSEFSSEDYTGRYEVSLVPCMLVDSMDVCSPRPNIIFPLDIHLQQISDPVLKKYTLNTSFHLIKKRETKESVEESSMFEPGDQVYGFIKMEPPQSHLELMIDQCYVCSGRNGRTPKYNPKKKEYGCLMESPDLQYSVKIIDRHTPSSTQKSLKEMNFNASLIRRNENNSVTSLLGASNVDIFHFDITPLFTVKSAKVWFVHCTFTIRSSSGERLSKRSVSGESGSGRKPRKGTNMRRLVLQEPTASLVAAPRQPTGTRSSFLTGTGLPRADLGLPTDQIHVLWLASVLFVLSLSLVLTLVLLCYIVHVKKEIAEKKKTNFSNVNYRECLTNDCNY